MKKRASSLALFGGICGLLLFAVVNSNPIDHYVTALKVEESGELPDVEDEAGIRARIEEWRKTREQRAINAKLDPIWKAIPGYNGRVVDMEGSLRRWRETGSLTPEQLVYKEVAPDMTLDQLGAHPLYRGNPQKPAVSFMVNVAWGNEHLDAILHTLDRYGVKTTFFLDGSWVRRYPDLAKKIAERGHEIGNHAYSHPDMSKLSAERIRQEIGKTQSMIQQATGIKPKLFAPPSGAFNQQVVQIAAREFQLKTILWTADTVDWRKPPLEAMVRRVTDKLGNGVLVLMHPTEVSAKGLDRMLQAAKAKGLTPTTVSEVIAESRLDSR